ncbi:hypothetical protein AVEN_231828-1 [Araneus ventricosus]|uniref:Uncharacterized protein n=1 Tax=Araneus ventricosus TaxID=182803 RepID=A0A4Y2X456_ARAVE|nr:hypothetical protein AVEN_231828-1 [Araneus ventricosus]
MNLHVIGAISLKSFWDYVNTSNVYHVDSKPNGVCRWTSVMVWSLACYLSVALSLLARTADRTPKTFALQGDPSRSTTTPSSKRSLYIVSPAGREVTWNDLAHSCRIFSPNSDIEKIPAPLRSHISSPNSRQVAKFVAKVRGPDGAAVGQLILTPVKLSSQP